MTEEQKYCKHCGKPYRHQRSGYGCFDGDNNELYCPECMEVILKALREHRPINYCIRKFRETTEITYDQLLPLKKKYDEYYDNKQELWGLTFKPMKSLRLMMHCDGNKVAGEGYYYNDYEYVVTWEKTNPEIKTITVLTEYYPDTKKWGSPIRTSALHGRKQSDSYYDIGFAGYPNIDEIKPTPMPSPSGQFIC